MSIEIVADPDLPEGVRVVALTQYVDLSMVRRLRAVLAQALAGSVEVRIDLSELRAIDSAGIRELLRAQALAARNQQRFGVSAANERASRILERADARGLMIETTS
jgi:anti-anti-sigma regulatory factor